MLPNIGFTELKISGFFNSLKTPISRYGFISKIFTSPFVKIKVSEKSEFGFTDIILGFNLILF